MKPYDINYDVKTGVFNAQQLDDIAEPNKEQLSSLVPKGQLPNTGGSSTLKKASKGKNPENPYKMYNTATEQDPE